MEFSTLNGYEVKDKKAIRYYDSVADMKNDTTLKNGMYAITKGYYSINDGGGCEYHITNTQTSSDIQELLTNGLYANLIFKNKNKRTRFKDTTGTMQAGSLRDIASEVGMKWARMSFVWESCEIEQGVIDETRLQGFVDNFLAYKNLGINTLALLCYNNTNYVSDEYDAIETTENLNGFINFCQAVANKIKNNNVVYLIWNEPNGNFWKSSRKEYYYVNMIKEVSEAIKAIDPTAKIAGPEQGGIDYYSTSQDTSISSSTFFENCCKEGLLDYIDYISYHAYYDKDSEKIIDINNSSNIYLTKGIASKYTNKNIPIIITEFGGSTYTGGITEEEQARGIVKSYIINNAYDVKISSQYSFLDTGSDTTSKEDNFGMAYQNGTLKTSGTATKFLISLLGDYYFNRKENLLSNNDYCFVYDNGNKNSKEIYCLWTVDDSHTIDLPSNLVGCKLYDMLGNESTTSATLTITKNPQYIEVLEPFETNYVTKEDFDKIINIMIQESNHMNLKNNDSKIGVNNILENSNFAYGKKYITDWESTSEVITDNSINDKVLKITSTGQGSYFNNAYKCNVGDVLTWSCWIKTDTFCNIAVGCEAGETYSASNYKTERTGILRCDVNPNEWKKISKTFVVSRTDHNNFTFFTQTASAENPIEILVYNPQIVKSNTIKNDYSPKLLDYEYGTFTPTLENVSQTSEATYTSREGHYFKIGNLVYFDLKMVISTVGENIGTCVVGGLPFTSANNTGVTLGNTSGLNINPHTQIIACTNSGSKRINIKKLANDGTGTDLVFGNVSANANIVLSGIYYTN